MDAFVAGSLPQKRKIEIDVSTGKSERKKTKNTTVVISMLALQSQKGQALSNLSFVAEF